jgi:hypothetical protein
VSIAVVYLPILSNITLGLPVVLLLGAGVVWWLTTRATTPPRLVAEPTLRPWRVNSVAATYSSLRRERHLLPSYVLRERLLSVARERFGVSPDELRTGTSSASVPKPVIGLTVRRVLRDLDVAYASAYLAEEAPPWGPLGGLLTPRRRQRAVRAFERASREVEEVLATWGPAA